MNPTARPRRARPRPGAVGQEQRTIRTDERDEQVHRRPGQDHHHPLPHRLVVVERADGSARARTAPPRSDRWSGPVAWSWRRSCSSSDGVSASWPRISSAARTSTRDLLLLELLLPGVHAGDLHVAAERDRADSVLGLAPRLNFTSSGPKNSENRSTRMPDGLRGHEVARLVEDDQCREAEERVDVGHERDECGRRGSVVEGWTLLASLTPGRAR